MDLTDEEEKKLCEMIDDEIDDEIFGRKDLKKEIENEDVFDGFNEEVVEIKIPISLK